MKSKIPSGAYACLLAIAVMTGGCAAVGAGAAGAAAGVYFTDRGAESLVKAPVDQVYEHSRTVFREMGIKITRTEIDSNGGEREIEGKKDDTEVTVVLTEDAESETQVEVIAQKSAVTWDKDFARKVLANIVKES